MPLRWWESLKELLTRARGDADLERELQSHLDAEADELIESGVDPEEAPWAARRAFGNLTRATEKTRESWRLETAAASIRQFAEGVRRDARDAIRGLLKQPGFTAGAVLALALGIGATTTIFSVIKNVLVDPYPMYTHADRMVGVAIHDDASSEPGGRDFLQTAEFLDYASQLTSFDEIIAGTGEDVLYTSDDGTEQFDGALVSGNTFQALGIDALLGRTITPADAAPDAAPVFVISYKLWVRRFGADPSLVGRSFTLGGTPTTLIGVMPPRVSKLGADIWRPVLLDRANLAQRGQFFKFQARLKPGVTIEQADAEFRTVAARVSKSYPRNYPERFTAHVIGFVDSIVRGFKTTLYTMAAAVGLLLLIACANVANLLLSRATGRQREIALRRALGASRGRIVRQLLVESLVLALLGAAVGCGFAAIGVKALVAVMPDYTIPRESLIRLDTSALTFTLALGGVTAVLFGLVPALQTVTKDLMNPLRDAGKGTGGGFRGGRLSTALVVAEIALSLVLLNSAGLLMRSFIELQTQELGLDPENLLIMRIPVGTGRLATAGDQTRFLTQVLERIRSVPGVVDASTTVGLPVFGGLASDFDVQGIAHADRWRGGVMVCSDAYFRTLRVALLTGRDFTADDLRGARKVAIVNQVFVDRFLKGTDAIGRRLTLKLPDEHGQSVDQTMEIIGVAASARNRGPSDPAAPEAFVPVSAAPMRSQGLLIRTKSTPLAMVQTLKHEIWAVDPGVAVAETDELMTFIRRFSYAAPRLGLFVFGAFATIGLVLVILGVHSLIAYTVARQTREIGIRMAIGADRGDVLRLTVGMGLRWLVLGIVIGLAVSVATTRVLASQLTHVSPSDPLTFGLVVVIISIAGLAASYIPALRTTRVDPMVVLRHET